jgi:penicillin-binding protein 1A
MIKVVKDPLLAQYRPQPFEKLDRRVVKKDFDCSNGSYALPDSLQVSDSELDSMNALLEQNAQPADSTGSPQ